MSDETGANDLAVIRSYWSSPTAGDKAKAAQSGWVLDMSSVED